MKKTLLFLSLIGTLTACNNADKQAATRLAQAQAAYEQGLYDEAKLHIDSIKLLYPKAYDTRRAGNDLRMQVELAQLAETLAYYDSTLQQRRQQAEELSQKFVFEKDAEYEQTGHYIAPSQVIEKNLNRSFLRFRVDENGVLKMTSIYVGAQNIHHIGVKVTAPDGSFAETPASTDSYETTNLGQKIEKADFSMGNDGNVISFIYLNRDKNLRVSYQGERPYTTTMTPADRQALVSAYDLAQQLSAVAELKKAMEEARVKQQFIEKKIAHDQANQQQ